jgi:hyaluronan synthase
VADGDDPRRSVAGLAYAVPVALIAVLHGWVGASYVGTTMMVLLLAKLALARRALRREHPSADVPFEGRVGLVMPLHNEDPALAVAAVRSMLCQSRPLDRLHVVDDGSADATAVDAVEAVLRDQTVCAEWQVTRLAENVGKRNAMAVGFRAGVDLDVVVCVDSDTVLDPRAVEEGLVPFVAPDVTAVAGLVTALNWRRNLLTRLIDLRYVSAFLSERAAYSCFGAVLCCCGSLSLYRGALIRANLDDFVDQRFLGQVATYGDDRRLTNYALRAGRVVLAPAARARTAVPERLGHYLRQQIRWNKSFVRESTWVLGTFPLGHPAFWLTLAEVVGWLVVGTLTLLAVAVAPLMADTTSLAVFAILTALAAYARNAAYLGDRRDGADFRDVALVFLLAPLYGVIHVVLLLPLRFISLLTLSRTGWGTRSRVEVTWGATA